jgi:hypothetical protein
MEAKDHAESESSQNIICRLEWIAWAMDAARRHKEGEQLGLTRNEDAEQPAAE